jgi:hypothetical protein
VVASLLVVVLGYLALVLVFSLRTPAWENDDELGHVQYVEHVVTTGRLPPIAVASGDESHQAPLYYLLVAAWQRVDGIPAFHPEPLPAAVGEGVKHRELVHDYTVSERAQAGWVHRLRLVSIGCGLLTVLAAYATGWLLTGATSVAAAIAAAVAAWPKFLVVAAAVTNSSLAEALCACALPCWLRWHRTRSTGWAAATGVVLGAAVLTQVTALPLTVLLLAGIAAAGLSRLDRRSPIVATCGAAAVCGWWFVRNEIRYGDPLATRVTDQYLKLIDYGLIRPRQTLSPAVVIQQLPTLEHNTWYSGGWDQLQLPGRLDAGLWIAATACLIAALGTRPGRHFVIVAGAATSVAAWLLIVRQTTHGQGRYLLTGVTAWATVLVAGAGNLVRRRRAVVGGGAWFGGRVLMGGRWLIWLWPAVFLCLDGYVIATFLIPYGGL